MAVYLHMLSAKTAKIQVQATKDVEDGFSAFCQRLAIYLPSLAAARRRGSGDAMVRYIDSFQNIFAVLGT